MINLVTAFTGFSAIDFALKYESIKYNHLMACEIDKYARKQFLEFHESPPEFPSDVSSACGKHLKGRVDLYCFGSPCQDLSLAGKRKGFDGEKSSLFRHGARLLSEMLPKVFIFENVKGLLSSNSGADYKEVEKTFRELGYHMAMKVVNAKEQGTAQNRERVFIVGFLDESDYHNFSFADSVPLTKCLRDYLEDDVDEKYYPRDKMIKGFTNKPNKNFKFKPHTKKEPQLIQVGNIDKKGHNSLWGRVYSPDGIGANLNANGGGAGAKTGLYAVEPKIKAAGHLQTKFKQRGQVLDTNGISSTLDTCEGGGRETKILEPFIKVGVKSSDNDISNPLKGKTPFGWHFEQNVYAEDSKCVRTLMAGQGSGSRAKILVKDETESFQLTERRTEEARAIRKKSMKKGVDFSPRRGKELVPRTDGMANTVTATQGKEQLLVEFKKDNAVVEKSYTATQLGNSLSRGNSIGGDKVAFCLRASEPNGLIEKTQNDFRIRRLTPRECFRLMGLKDEDIVLVNSDSQSYKIAGNGIEVNTMRSIIGQLYKPVKSQLSLF